MKRSQGLSSILSALLIFIIAITIVGTLTVRTDTFSTTMKSFYVTCGDDDFYGDREHYKIQVDKTYTFEVKDNLKIDSSESNFIVSIVPNKSLEDFNFKSKGTEVSFHSIRSLGAGFTVTSDGNIFTLQTAYTLSEILGLLYEDVTDVPTDNKPYLRLVITSSDGTDVININFSISE
jgi:hypothetical protein